MEVLLILLLVPMPDLVERVSDPSHAIWQSRTQARNMDCVRMSQARAHELYPGRVPEPEGRTTPGAQFGALACTRRFVGYGERADRDEAILSNLRQSVGELTEVASARVPGADVTWHVDAYYPSPAVAAKISVAARMHLAETGRRVSDRVPLLAAGDLSVLSRMGAREAYALACARYFQHRALAGNEAFLGLMIVDPRETQLHAGVCVDGVWRWLQ
jgi:hypothetical protein